jgi:hypothetical protein
LNAVTEEVLMMDPPAFMCGTAALMISKHPAQWFDRKHQERTW